MANRHKAHKSTVLEYQLMRTPSGGAYWTETPINPNGYTLQIKHVGGIVLHLWYPLYTPLDVLRPAIHDIVKQHDVQR